MLRRTLLALSLVLASTSLVWASGLGATDPSNLVEVERLARAGDVNAQTYLGLVHDVGAGIRQDTEKAAHWYRMAADRGNADAQMFLGSAYLQGRGVTRDYASALMWLELAAKGLSGDDKTTCECLLDEALWSASP